MSNNFKNSASVLHKFLPFLKWFKNYNIKTLNADIIAALTVGVILIPQVMAYADIAGLAPQYGLYAALWGVSIAALWGSSAQLSTGPVAIVSLLTGAAILPLVPDGDMSKIVVLAAALALLVGIIQFLLGALKLGFIMRFVSHSVVVGFATAAAIIIAMTQVPKLFGFATEGRHEYILETMKDLFTHLPNFDLLTTIIGLSAVLLILIFKEISPRIPGAFITLIIFIVLSTIFALEAKDVKVIGNINVSIPSLKFPDLSWKTISHMLPQALVISIVGFLEAFAVSKSIAAVTRQKTDVNQELIGQGLGNIVSAASKGYPISGSFSRSAVNFSAGAKTGMSSVFVSIMILVTILYLTPYLKALPQAVLAAIVIVAVLGLVDFRKFKSIYNISKTDGIIASITFAFAFLLKPDDAIFIGIILSLILFIKNTLQVKVTELGLDKKAEILKAVWKKGRKLTFFEKTLIARVDMSVFYINAETVTEKVENLIKEKEKKDIAIENVVLNMSGVNYMDIAGVEAFEELISDFKKKNIKLYFIYVKTQVQDIIKKTNLGNDIMIFDNIAQMKKLLKEGETLSMKEVHKKKKRFF